MKKTTCPLCKSSQYSVVEKYHQIGAPEYGCRLVHCETCGHCFTDIHHEVDFNKLYQDGQYELMDTRQTLFGKVLSFDDKIVIRQLNRLRPQKGAMLDFGCGKGAFIFRAAHYGWQVKGIETAKKRARFGVEIYGVNISTDEYLSGSISGGPFDVITLFHIIEHLSQPIELLQNLIEDNLAKNGWVVIEVPRFDSLQSKIAGGRWIHLDPPFHVSHFSTKSIMKLINDVGLEVKVSGQFSIHNGLLGMVQSVMSVFGYRKMLIAELKLRRTTRLLAAVAMVLPVAVLLESFAILVGRGGVIRLYCQCARDLS